MSQPGSILIDELRVSLDKKMSYKPQSIEDFDEALRCQTSSNRASTRCKSAKACCCIDFHTACVGSSRATSEFCATWAAKIFLRASTWRSRSESSARWTLPPPIFGGSARDPSPWSACHRRCDTTKTCSEWSCQWAANVRACWRRTAGRSSSPSLSVVRSSSPPQCVVRSRKDYQRNSPLRNWSMPLSCCERRELALCRRLLSGRYNQEAEID